MDLLPQLQKKEAEKALDAFIASITESLKKGEKVSLIGFGAFETRHRAVRIGGNPQTKETITIQQQHCLHLKQARH